MDIDQIIKETDSVMLMDFAAAKAYEQALGRVEFANDLRSHFVDFKNDHDRHIEVFAKKIRSLGHDPSPLEPSGDYLVRDLPAGTQVNNFEDVIKALYAIELTTNKHYHEALKLPLPYEYRDMFERNYQDEQRHLAYLKIAVAMLPVTTAAH